MVTEISVSAKMEIAPPTTVDVNLSSAPKSENLYVFPPSSSSNKSELLSQRFPTKLDFTKKEVLTGQTFQSLISESFNENMPIYLLAVTVTNETSKKPAFNLYDGIHFYYYCAIHAVSNSERLNDPQSQKDIDRVYYFALPLFQLKRSGDSYKKSPLETCNFKQLSKKLYPCAEALLAALAKSYLKITTKELRVKAMYKIGAFFYHFAQKQSNKDQANECLIEAMNWFWAADRSGHKNAKNLFYEVSLYQRGLLSLKEEIQKSSELSKKKIVTSTPRT